MNDGVRRRGRATTVCIDMAAAWHARVMADEVVGHAFNHGFHPPAHPNGWPRTGRKRSVVRTTTRRRSATRPQSCACTGGNGPHEEMDRRAIECFDGGRWSTSASTGTSGSERCSTPTSRGRPRPRCPAITARRRRAGRLADPPVVLGTARPARRDRRWWSLRCRARPSRCGSCAGSRA